jgi:hypothetical protein
MYPGNQTRLAKKLAVCFLICLFSGWIRTTKLDTRSNPVQPRPGLLLRSPVDKIIRLRPPQPVPSESDITRVYEKYAGAPGRASFSLLCWAGAQTWPPIHHREVEKSHRS